jgi:hypothetical protein
MEVPEQLPIGNGAVGSSNIASLKERQIEMTDSSVTTAREQLFAKLADPATNGEFFPS